MATWDMLGHVVFRPGTITNYTRGEAEFTSDENIYVAVYEVPDSYIRNPSSAVTSEMMAKWPELESADFDQRIVSMVSESDTGGGGQRIYFWGEGKGRATVIGEDDYSSSGIFKLPAEFIIVRSAESGWYIPFVLANGKCSRLTTYFEGFAMPTEVYLAGTYDWLAFICGLTAGLTGKGDPDFGIGKRTVINWDGSTSGLVSTSSGNMFKVSDIVPEKDELPGGTVVDVYSDGDTIAVGITEESIVEFDEAVFTAAGVYICKEDNHVLTKGENVTFPEKGIYFVKTSAVYTAQLSYGRGMTGGNGSEVLRMGYLTGAALRRKRSP